MRLGIAPHHGLCEVAHLSDRIIGDLKSEMGESLGFERLDPCDDLIWLADHRRDLGDFGGQEGLLIFPGIDQMSLMQGEMASRARHAIYVRAIAPHQICN